MSKEKKPVSSKDEAFEIIELALNDVETLAEAFRLIDQVCEEMPNPQLVFDADKPESVIN